jgi:hypothetical protein
MIAQNPQTQQAAFWAAIPMLARFELVLHPPVFEVTWQFAFWSFRMFWTSVTRAHPQPVTRFALWKQCALELVDGPGGPCGPCGPGGPGRPAGPCPLAVFWMLPSEKRRPP